MKASAARERRVPAAVPTSVVLWAAAMLPATSIAPRLAALLNGTLRVKESDGPTGALIEYRLLDSPTPLAVRFYDKSAMLHCLAGRSVALIGDSRMRYIFASLAARIAPGDGTLPRHRACPFSNKPHQHTAECSRWYLEGCSVTNVSNSSRCLLRAVDHGHAAGAHAYASRVSIAYVANRWASDLPQVLSQLEQLRPDIVLANVGAWSVFLAKGLAQTYDAHGAAGHSGETSPDRLRFFQGIRKLQLTFAQGQSAIAVAMGYPECGCSRRHTRMCANKYVFDGAMRDALYASGWMVYHPAAVTSGTVWADRDFGSAWADPMLPRSELPAVVKAEQCQGVHTFDTLADLEVQILMNAVCDVGSSTSKPSAAG